MEELPAVSEAAHACCQELIDAGAYVVAGGLSDQPMTVVATDGTVRSGPQTLGGLTIVDVPSREEALAWAAKLAAACRCAQEVRELAPDPELDGMLREAGARTASG